MRGIKSHAMVLCVRDRLMKVPLSHFIVLKATSKDGKDAGIELVEPPAGSTAGERVFFEGFEGKLL